ncbi:MAG TPA: hypothetical protein VIJ95_11240 [Hanamia sp.]
MEVHHHPDLHHKKKNFKEYFLEFLMIFLAVTLGFIAESIREHFVETKITRQYLESLKLELVHNKNIYYAADSFYASRLPIEDSIVKIFKAQTENADLHTISRLVFQSRKQYMPKIEISAYNELVNSGGLKYINNRFLKDSLAKYESLIEGFQTYNTAVNNYMLSGFAGITSLEDLSDYIDTTTGHIAVMAPYPALTEKERREITNYYTFHFVRTYANRKNIDMLIESDKNLLNMVEKQIENY